MEINFNKDYFPRTSHNIVYEDDKCFLIIKYCNKEIKILIDEEDISIIERYKTAKLCRDGYVYLSRNNKLYALHRVVVNCPNDKCVDHINHNKLDNRKVNLRICTYSENSLNTAYTPKYNQRGVYYNKRDNVWIVSFTKNRKRYFYGTYKSYKQAVTIAKSKEQELFH